MKLFDSIMKLFDSGPQGPSYSVEDIRFHHDNYRTHAIAAHDCLDRMMTDPRWVLILRDPDRKVDPVELLAKVRWNYLDAIRGWAEDYFYERIFKYNIPNAPSPQSDGVRIVERIADDPDRPIETALSHMQAMDGHGKSLIGAINFFLCDMRSSFDQTRAYEVEFGPSSPIEITRWYANGRDIVQRNIDRIGDNLNRFVEFARRNS